MLNKYIKLISLLFFSLSVSGCGGSGGGDSTENGKNTEERNNEVYVVEAESTTEPRLTIDALVAAEDFTFSNKNNIQILLELTVEQRAYVSVYSKYQLLDSGNYYPDPVSKVVAGALQDGIYKESFTGLNNQQQYLIEVWFYDGSDPLQKELLVNDNRLLL